MDRSATQVYSASSSLTASSSSPCPIVSPLGDFSRDEKEAIEKCLRLHLSPDYIAFRPQGSGAAAGQVAYIEGWRAIELANETFGFGGWTSSVQDMSVDFVDQTAEGKFFVGVSAIVRITLRNGIFHEDIGYGLSENIKSKGNALEKAKKEAVTDAIKRTLRLFGNSLGNSVYDKEYTKAVGTKPQVLADTKKKRGEHFFDKENMRSPSDEGPKRFKADSRSSDLQPGSVNTPILISTPVSHASAMDVPHDIAGLLAGLPDESYYDYEGTTQPTTMSK